MTAGDLLAAAFGALVGVLSSFLAFRQSRDRLREEFKSEFMAEAAIRRLLMHERFNQRSFKHIRDRIGGFSDDELRQKLVRAGAVRFWSEKGVEGGRVEWWGLVDRNKDVLDLREPGQPDRPHPDQPGPPGGELAP